MYTSIAHAYFEHFHQHFTYSIEQTAGNVRVFVCLI